MTLTEANRPAQPGSRSAASSRKIAAVASALLAVSLFMTVAVVNVPHDATDSELQRWWQESANRWSGVFSGLFAICTAALIAVVLNYLRELPQAVRSPQWLGFARSMGAAVTAVWLVTGAARAAIGHLVDVMDEPLPGTDVLRTITAFNYVLLGLSGMAVLALCIGAVSVWGLRAAALPRWECYLGLGCALLMLLAVAAQYGAYTTPLAIFWALGLAVAIWRQPGVVTEG
jgi:hypothetical protein